MSLARRDALARAMRAHEKLSLNEDARERARGTATLRVATPISTRTRDGREGKDGAVTRSPLATLSGNARVNGTESGGVSHGDVALDARGKKSRLARSTSASDEEVRAVAGARGAETTFEPVESVDEVLRRLSLRLNETQRREFKKIYDECLEAKSLRVAIENVKDTELRAAHRDALRTEEFVRASVDAHEKKDEKMREMEANIAELRARARESHRELESLRMKNAELIEAERGARAPQSKKLVSASTQTAAVASTQTADDGLKGEMDALRKQLEQAKTRVERESRVHGAEFDALSDELAESREAKRRLEQEVARMRDEAAFYLRCSNTADERANVAEETACALRDEVLESQAEVKRLKAQIARVEELAAKDKESIMAALASAQARASEAENVPLAQRMNFPEASMASDLPCKCGSVATAKRLSAALMEAAAKNNELQGTIWALENKLAKRATSESTKEVEALEERARAAERRVEVARVAMQRYVKESQKCSPAPAVYATVDELTPMKRAVERWIEVSEAKHENERETDSEESEDDFDSPPRRLGTLPTPRLRARAAIRRTHGPAPRLPPGAYKPASDDELRRRAKVMGLSVSPFGRPRE